MENRQVNNENEQVMQDPVDRLLLENRKVASGKGTSILALLLALAAAGLAGWQLWNQQQEGPADNTQQLAIDGLQSAQQQLAGSINSIESRLDNSGVPVDPAEFSRLVTQFRAAESELNTLRGFSGEQQVSMGAAQEGIRSLEQRLSMVESGLVSVAASNQNSSEELDIAEIDYLLRAASERLQLFADPIAADLALQAADVQIDALNDPLFLSVRQPIATARQALAAVPRVDHVPLSAQLSDIQMEIRGLPFRGEAFVEPEPVLTEDAGWWDSFKHSMSSLVSVRRRVPEDQSLLTLEDKDYLRQGLWLQVESTRLALMRSDVDVYTASLGRVSDTIDEYFQQSSPGVQKVQARVRELQQLDIAPVMPDISAPWTRLRQLRDSRRLLQPAPPPENAESGQ